MDALFRVAEVAVIPVVVALIAGAASVISVRKLRSENTDQHNQNSNLLYHLSNQVTGIDTKVDKLDNRLDNVQAWQADHEKNHLIADRDNSTL